MTHQLVATLERFTLASNLPRSSHSLNVIDGTAYLFGGEIKPREPVDASVNVFQLTSGSSAGKKQPSLEAESVAPLAADDGNKRDATPSPRVGHTSATVAGDIYVWGGRSGVDPKPLEENGRVWRFSTSARTWSALDPTDANAPFPEGRSYHAATGGDSADGRFFVHAGCPASGRSSDLWSFDVQTKAWKQLPNAPGAPRGGPGFVYALGKLWRYGGFDGKQSLGGRLDYLDVTSARSRGAEWQSVDFAEGKCPGGRSVTGLHAVTVAGQDYLAAFFGEKDASSLGHAGAGLFWGDIWTLALSKDGEPASDAWQEAQIAGGVEGPQRGWFDSDKAGFDAIAVYGGLNDKNEREDNGYLISFSKAL